ncbi:phosphoesterase [Candidatus Woesearchaeota archaeon CG10_big_fil_rev_8_21_14_0_10_32_24]|nr:MAG: phosphoesterase [Candidatus Woesearchaeota archaeon CG10_big_fil_rev_8_21_14_0_10_32_24]
MDIHPNIRIIGTSLFLEESSVLIINDLHIGYEGELRRKGIMVPRFQLKQIMEKMDQILKVVKPKKILINGDLKHEFGGISREEWNEVLQFLDYLLERVEEVIIVQGNHDPIIKPIAEKRNVKVVKEFKLKEGLVIHGDQLVNTDKEVIVIGHEHPAISIKEGSKIEKYKCFLKGTFQNKIVIVVPSFNPLLEGTDVLQGQMLSPFLKKIEDFNVFVVNKGEAFGFGKLKNVN